MYLLLLVEISSQGRRFLFTKTSANFLGKSFRISPRKKKEVAAGCRSCAVLWDCTHWASEHAECQLSQVVRAHVREQMLSRCPGAGVAIALINGVAHGMFLAVQRVPSFLPAECRSVFPAERGSVLLAWSSTRFPFQAQSPEHGFSTVQCYNERLAKHLPDSTLLLLYSSCSPSLDDILAWFVCWFDTTVEQIVAVYHSASKQKAWDHFTKAQRKNISVWCKQAEVGNFLLC